MKKYPEKFFQFKINRYLCSVNNKSTNQLNYSKMEKVVYFVALCYSGDIFIPSIVEKFDNLTDAESYAALIAARRKRGTLCLSSKPSGTAPSGETNNLSSRKRNNKFNL